YYITLVLGVDVGLARAGLHLHGKVAGGQRLGGLQPVAKLHIVEVGEDLIVEQRQPVADTQVVRKSGKGRLAAAETLGDGELGATDLLAPEEVADRFDRGVLIVEIRFKMAFHGASSIPRNPAFRVAAFFSWSAVSSQCPRAL